MSRSRLLTSLITPLLVIAALPATAVDQPRSLLTERSVEPSTSSPEDREQRRFENRAEADRRQFEKLQTEQRLTDPSADREVQRFKNRAEADRRQFEKLQTEQRLTDPSGAQSRS